MAGAENSLLLRPDEIGIVRGWMACSLSFAAFAGMPLPLGCRARGSWRWGSCFFTALGTGRRAAFLHRLPPLAVTQKLATFRPPQSSKAPRAAAGGKRRRGALCLRKAKNRSPPRVTRTQPPWVLCCGLHKGQASSHNGPGYFAADFAKSRRIQSAKPSYFIHPDQ